MCVMSMSAMAEDGASILIETANKLLQQKIHDDDCRQHVPFIVRQTTESSEDHLIFSGKKSGILHEWISEVNTSLSKTASRLEGLVLLRTIIKQCSLETFTECCLTWARLLIAIFQPHQSAHIIEVAAGVLVEVLRGAAQISEVSRDLAVNHIPGLLATLLGAEDQWIAPSLRLLSVCMRCFPGPCGAISYKLEAFITCHLDSNQDDIRELSQQCYPQLAGLGGGGSGGVKHTEAHRHYTAKLLCSLNGRLGLLYEDLFTDPAQTSNEDVEPLHLPSAPSEEPLQSFRLTGQVESLASCLQNMLRGDFPAPAVIPVTSILECVSKALEVTSKTLSEHVSVESSMLALVTPRIHQAALGLLTALIESCCVSHYNHQVNQLLMRTLGWAQTEDTAKYSTLRSDVYKSIVTWLKTTGASSGLANQAGDKLVQQCIKDASPPSDTTKLVSSVQTKVDKKGGKVKVKGRSGVGGSELSGSRKLNQHAAQTLCLAALQALRQLLLTSGVKLKAGLHNEIYGFVIPLLTKIQSSAPSDVQQPYTSLACRLELYRVLLAGLLVPHPQASSPLCLAVGLFREGKNDRSLEVSSVCTEAAVICEAIIHPRRPPVPSPASRPPPSVVTLRPSTESAGPGTASHLGDSEAGVYTSNIPAAMTAASELAPATSVTKSAALPVDDGERSPRTASADGQRKAAVAARTHSDRVESAEREPKVESQKGSSREDSSAMEEGVLEVEVEEEGEREEEEEEEGREMGGDSPTAPVPASKGEGSGDSSTRKRKLSATEPEQAKKPASEEVESMMAAFVDAPPDSE